MIVHCSAGVGRTGTFIVIDSMLSKVIHEDSYIDIYRYVTLLRNKRNYMIQTDVSLTIHVLVYYSNNIINIDSFLILPCDGHMTVIGSVLLCA